MVGTTAMAIAGGLQSLGQLGYGIYQQQKAKQLAKKLGPQPQYKYDLAKNAVAGELALAQGEAPGLTQQMQGINQNLANVNQNIAKMAPSGAAGLGALVQAGASAMDTTNQALGNAAIQKLGLQQQYLQSLSNLQGYEDKAFEVNQYNPYMQKLQQIQDLRAAGTENVGSAFQAAGDTIMGIGEAKAAQDINETLSAENIANSILTGNATETEVKAAYAKATPALQTKLKEIYPNIAF